VITVADVSRVLEGVIDPELGLDVVSLGMVREVAIHEGRIEVGMTLTTATCPFWELFVEQVRIAVSALPGAASVDVKYVVDPPWHPDLMTPDARQYLDERGYLPRIRIRNSHRGPGPRVDRAGGSSH
jgi:metal-sulfur cluster biosynthetic enzyme